MSTTNRATIEDLARLPNDGKRYELIEGEIIELSPSGIEHGIIAAFFVAALVNYTRSGGISGYVATSDAGFVLRRDPDRLLAPDVAFIGGEELPEGEALRGYSDRAPRLVVEVSSPSDNRRDEERKVHFYLEAGVRLVWLVDPVSRMVTAFKPGAPAAISRDGDALSGDDVLPGFDTPVRGFFI